MLLEDYISKIKTHPENIIFDDTLAIIDSNYDFKETEFSNGEEVNKAGENSGSCKVFAFAIIQNLSKDDTLSLFAQYYFNDVLKNPEGSDHQNIRQFMVHGFAGVNFLGEALIKKETV
jgi:hypothetical protein